MNKSKFILYNLSNTITLLVCGYQENYGGRQIDTRWFHNRQTCLEDRDNGPIYFAFFENIPVKT